MANQKHQKTRGNTEETFIGLFPSKIKHWKSLFMIAQIILLIAYTIIANLPFWMRLFIVPICAFSYFKINRYIEKYEKMSNLPYCYFKPVDFLFNDSEFSLRLMRHIIRVEKCNLQSIFDDDGTLTITVFDKHESKVFYCEEFLPTFSLKLYGKFMMKKIIESEKCRFYAKLTPIDEVKLVVEDKYEETVYIDELDFRTFDKNFHY